MPISPEFLNILRCPDSRAPLVQEEDTLISTHAECRRRYRIDDGIPNLIIEDSEVMEVDDWVAAMARLGVIPKGGGADCG
jgi:uncharacterized protein YbaR (Trm112 family)